MYHFQRSVNDWPRAVEKLPDGALVKAVDRGDILRDVKAINPNLYTMLRHYGPGQHFGGTLEQNKQAAREFFTTFIDGTFRDQYAPHVDFVQEFNEYLASSHTGAELDDRLTWAEAVAWVWANEYRTQSDYSHIRLALVNCPIGNDIDRRFAEIAIKYDCVLSYHAYSHYIDGQRDPGDWIYHSGRWAQMEQRWGLHPDWLFGEAGPYASVWDGWRSSKCQGGNVQAYVEAVRAFIRDVQTTDAYKQGRLYGFALFTTGGGSMWSSYETKQPEMDALATMIAEEWAPGNEPIVDREPDPPSPPEVTDYIEQLTTNTKSEFYPYDIRSLSEIDNIIIHHSAGAYDASPEHINDIHQGHDRYWPRIGYHYYITGDGTIYKTNHLTTHSYHAGTWNRSSIGICLAGNFTDFWPLADQLDSARFLISWLNDALGSKKLLKHRDVASTQCPGNTWAEWWSMLTEETEAPRGWRKLVYLLPQDTTRERYDSVADVALPTRSEIAFSADSAYARPPTATKGHKVVVYDVDAWGGRQALEDWVNRHYAYQPATEIEYRVWPTDADWHSPVGTEAERLSGEIWPGTWVDATGYATFYRYGNDNEFSAYHTGADLNLNDPSWDSDKGKPAYAVQRGVVTFSELVTGSTWGRLIVIRHKLADGAVVHSRYAHLASRAVAAGDTVERGRVVGTIGGAEFGLSNHLHFDVSDSGVLEDNPRHWPGNDRSAVLDNYADPAQWLREH